MGAFRALLKVFLVQVRQVVVFNPAGDAKGIVCFLGNDTQYLYPAFERALQMLSMWIMKPLLLKSRVTLSIASEPGLSRNSSTGQCSRVRTLWRRSTMPPAFPAMPLVRPLQAVMSSRESPDIAQGTSQPAARSMPCPSRPQNGDFGSFPGILYIFLHACRPSQFLASASRIGTFTQRSANSPRHGVT